MFKMLIIKGTVLALFVFAFGCKNAFAGSGQDDLISKLSRQLMIQQLMFEEKLRDDGDSGIKQCRINNGGTKSYHTPTHMSKRGIAAVHDHSNHRNTVGMGEFAAVLNGVEFRTRHNDYVLRMPSKTSRDWHATEDIPFPDVPPEVTSKLTVDEQIEEMRLWFKAFNDQDYSVRDYRKYFKPVICILEGAWLNKTWDTLEEPFQSDRHFLDAESLHDLHDQVLFNVYTGRKSNAENVAFLPTKIIDIVDGKPVFAQWSYRPICHPLSRDLPTNRLRVIDDLSARMMNLRTFEQHANSRRARFQLNIRDSNKWENKMIQNLELLDDLVNEIPGTNNYGAYMTDDAYNITAFNLRFDDFQEQNTAYYHRWYKTAKRDAMGLALRHRGFADKNIFMAMTDQPNVAETKVKYCGRKDRKDGNDGTCVEYKQRWTYAFPLEIIYMTPLQNWNPYDIEYKGEEGSPSAAYVEEGGKRTGHRHFNRAYNGTHSKLYYRTPAKFFRGTIIGADKADTFRGSVQVLDKWGNIRDTTSSGLRIFLPNIPDVGIIRLRYPIMPLYYEGGAIWKEIESLKAMVLEQADHLQMYRVLPVGIKRKVVTIHPVDLKLNPSRHGHHSHYIHLEPHDVKTLKTGQPLTAITTENAGHSHMVKILYKNKRFQMWRCDGLKECRDGHDRLTEL